MAHLDVKMTYQFQLDADEFRLLCKALSGSLSGEEKTEAAKLNVKLQTVRLKNAELAANACRRALVAAEDACEAGAKNGG